MASNAASNQSILIMKAKSTAKKKSAKPTAEAGASKVSTGKIGAIESFDSIPSPSTAGTRESSYDFASLTPGKALFVDVTGATKDEKERNAKKTRGNIFAAIYRYEESNPEAKNWKRSVRILTDENKEPTRVGFYLESLTKPAKA